MNKQEHKNKKKKKYFSIVPADFRHDPTRRNSKTRRHAWTKNKNSENKKQARPVYYIKYIFSFTFGNASKTAGKRKTAGINRKAGKTQNATENALPTIKKHKQRQTLFFRFPSFLALFLALRAVFRLPYTLMGFYGIYVVPRFIYIIMVYNGMGGQGEAQAPSVYMYTIIQAYKHTQANKRNGCQQRHKAQR